MATRDVNREEFLRRVPLRSHGIVAGFNQIFRPEAIGRFDTLMNVHPSVLPFYRGPSPSYWCLQNGEVRSGYTLHGITAAIDAGPVLFQGIVDLPPTREPLEVDRAIALAAVPVTRGWVRHVMGDAPWEIATVDHRDVYANEVNYRSTPPSGALHRS